METITLVLEEKEAKRFKRRNDDLQEHIQAADRAAHAIDLIQEDILRARGRVDALVEVKAEEKGFDFDQISKYSYDDVENTVTITLKKKEPVEPEPAVKGEKD